MKSSYDVHFKLYLRGIELIETGQIKRASELVQSIRSSLSPSQTHLNEMQSLLSARIALRACPQKFPAFLKQANSFTETYFKAEAFSLIGGLHYSNNDFENGVTYFKKAETLYNSQQNGDRALLAAFNAWIGKLSVISSKTDSDTLSEDDLAEYRTLAQASFNQKDNRIEGLLKRQLSIHYLSLGKYRATLFTAKEAETLLSRFACVGDAKIAVLLQTEAMIELGHVQEAQAKLETLEGQSDARSEFPIYYLKKKLGLITEEKSPESFSICNPVWKRRWQKAFDNRHDYKHLGIAKSEILKLGSLNGSLSQHFKAGSLERIVIENLSIKKHSKVELIEKLWPDQAKKEVLDNRFYRLMNRIKLKCTGGNPSTAWFRISYDGTYYFLERAEL